MTTKHFICMVAVLAFLAGTGAFADVYLSTTGNDGNDGLTAGTPKATLGAAIGVLNTQAAPTTLHIAAGTYTQNGIFNVTVVGTVANPVTIQGVGGVVTLNQSVLRISGAYTTVKDLTMDQQSQNEACIVLLSSAGNCTIQNCIFTGVLEVGQHFNPDLSEGEEPEDVAPVQIMAAPNCTITNCTFNANGSFWDQAILMPSATGPAGGLTVSGCTINGTSTTGGIKLLRASNNTQILNTTINNTRLNAIDFSTGSSPYASGNSDGLLIQNCVLFECEGLDSTHAVIRIYESLVSNITVRDTTMTFGQTNGIDGFSICGATAANILLERVNIIHPMTGDTGDYMVAFRQSTAPEIRAYVTNFEMRDCNVRGGNFKQIFNSDVNGYVFRNVHAICRSNWINTNFTGSVVNITNYVIEDCSYQDTHRTGGYGLTLGGVQVNIDGFTFTRSDFRHTFALHNLCVFPTGGSMLKNWTFTDSRLEANSCAFFLLGSTAENITIQNSLIGAGGACVLFQQWGSYRPYVTNLLIANTVLRNTTLTNDQDFIDYSGAGDIAGWHGCISMRDSGSTYDGVVLDGVTMTGTKGIYSFGFLNIGDEKRNFTLNNVVANVTREGILSTGSSVHKNWTLTNCHFTSADFNGIDVESDSSWENMNFQNCSFTGAVAGTQSAGFFVEQSAKITNATFADCDFTCRSVTDDTLQKRTAGLLMEDENSLLSGVGFTNCTFVGRNAGVALQRYQIQNGPGVEPQVQNVLFKNCTIEAATDRAVSLQYLKGANLLFENVALLGAPILGVYADFNGNGLRFVNTTFNGGGIARGMDLGSTLNFESANWLVKDSTFTNLTGVGVHLRNSVKESVFENVTLTGAAGATHGVYVNNTAATAPGARQANTISFLGCAVSGFGGDGLRLHGGGHTVQDCAITGAGGHGVNLRDDSALRPVNTNVQCVTNTITDCAGVGVVVEGQNHTIGHNTLLRNGQGVQVRSGVLRTAGQTSTRNNTVLRNCIYGNTIASGTGLWEPINTALLNDPGPNTNTYLNNTVTDWAQGTEFRGSGNRIQNNIFYFNTPGTDLRVLPSGLSGLTAGWNCAARVVGNQFDGLFIDYSKDIWYNPGIASRNPADPDFYLLGPTSPCRDRGTGDGVTADGVTDLGCIESGPSEVASWRLY